MKELKFEELSTAQKLGMVMAGIIRPLKPSDKKIYGEFDDNLEYTLELIRNHSLGAVWVPTVIDRRDEAIAKIKEAADYPILIFTDAESGLGDHLIGRHNAIGMADSEELAYTFGKVTAITARQMGYNVVCAPILDMQNAWGACGTNIRSLGCDKYRVTELAKAEARGLRDGGVLRVGKHYPGGDNPLRLDSHMAESYSELTEEALLNYYLYPYLELHKEGLLDGIMTSHKKFVNIDPDYPVSLSKKAIGIIREQGFDGFAITDALDMMGIKAKFGDTRAKGMCIEAGNEFILPWFSSKKAYDDLTDCYNEGIITDERLDEAVRRVLAAQHKVYEMEPKFTEYTDEDIAKFDRINRDSVYARTDDGLEVSIPRDKKHFFVVMAHNESDLSDFGKVSVDTFTNGWYYPVKIAEKLKELFPESAVCPIYQFPTNHQNCRVLQSSIGYDDVIFITFAEAPAYAGADNFTQRIQSLMFAMQMTNRISTVVHFGNPFVLEEIPHIPRLIIGGVSTANIDAALDVLAGKHTAKGRLTYDVNFK
ncbi:MAG: hypothetical protein IJ428_04035 [Clostridia bacterium]|nr:hypothetical protein [Clostridia bacterium]